MTTYAEILAFVKRQRRIASSDTQYDSVIGDAINSAYQTYCRRLQSLQAPGMRAASSFAVAAETQDYDLPADFDVLIDNSPRFYTTDDTDYTLIQVVSGPNAELWESMQSTYSPQACRVIAGSTGTQRKLRLLPAFTQTGITVAYAYLKRPATLSGSDVLELPELADAVAWNAIANTFAYFRDADDGPGLQMALARAKSSYLEVLGTLNP